MSRGTPPPGHRHWDGLTASERKVAADADPVVVLPLGATEQHGPHLPPTTDTEIAEGILAEALALLEPDLPVYRLPTRAVGASLEHTPHPDTRSVPAAELEESLVAEGTALARAGVRRLVLFNAHGGNKSVVDTAALRLRAGEGILVVKASYFRFPRPEGLPFPASEWTHGLHGGAVETAMMLHLRPAAVRREALRPFPSLGEELAGALRWVAPEGPAPFAWMAGDLNKDGVTGDATLADAETGSRLVAHYAAVLAEVIRDTARFPVERLAGAIPGDPSHA